jgi:hypothetical protein
LVYGKCCRIGGTLTLDDLRVGDWRLPDFRMACSYAVSQGGLIVQDDVLTLTTAGLGGGLTTSEAACESAPTIRR